MVDELSGHPVRVTEFLGPENAATGEGQTRHDISSCGVDHADTHHRPSAD